MSESDRNEQAEPSVPIDEVQGRLDEIKKSHRSRIRWRISKHTAEMAIAALESGEAPSQPRKSAKSRRRKRKKRLL